MTIEELKILCEEEINNGNGDNEIWLSNDDEGNGFHMLYYAFVTDEKEVEEFFDSCWLNKPEGNVAILG